jgi:chromosome segregation ATPase
MNQLPPVTKEEALRYKKEDLEREIAHIRKNIQVLQGEINNSEAQIARLMQMIAIKEAIG